MEHKDLTINDGKSFGYYQGCLRRTPGKCFVVYDPEEHIKMGLIHRDEAYEILLDQL